MDLNDDEPVQVSPHSRSMGRDKAKTTSKDKMSDSDELKEIGADMNGIKDRIDVILQLASEKEFRKQRDSDIRILTIDTSQMTEKELEIALVMKVDLKKRYANRS